MIMTDPGMRTWTVRYTDDRTGKPATLAPLTEHEARLYLGVVTSQIDPKGELVDLLAEVRNRIPVGTAVTHTADRTARGRITEVDALNVPGTPRDVAPGTTIAHWVDAGGHVTVHVEWDNGHAVWYAAAYIEALADVTSWDLPTIR